MRIFWLAIRYPPVELVHTLPGVRYCYFPPVPAMGPALDGTTVARFSDWSAEITGGDWHRRRNLPLHPVRWESVQPALLRIALPQRKPDYYTPYGRFIATGNQTCR